jgi:hypothetical protein
MYQWWITAKAPDYFREDCQGTILFTNEETSAPDLLPNAALCQPAERDVERKTDSKI